MPQGDIRIIEFTGRVSRSKQEEARTYLLVIDGQHHKKYGKPNFQYLPGEWRAKYVIGSLEVGEAESWKEFYALCARELGEASLLGNTGRPIPSEEAVREPEVPTHESDQTEPVPQPEAQEPRGAAQADSNNSLDAIAPLDPSIQGFYERLFDEPSEHPTSLRYEISGYLTILRTQAEQVSERDVLIARRIADGLLLLLDHVSSERKDHEAFRSVQAAIRYFTAADDAIPDSTEGGFDDDAAVFNLVAARLGRPDLVISLSHGPGNANE
jgi:hypothetical protein